MRCGGLQLRPQGYVSHRVQPPEKLLRGMNKNVFSFYEYSHGVGCLQEKTIGEKC